MDKKKLKQLIKENLNNTLDSAFIPELVKKGNYYKGKVRENYTDKDKRLIITTDKISAFDFVLGTIPFKGQILNEIAAFFLQKTKKTAQNALLSVPDSNAVLAIEASPIKVEAIVRAYITGSMARDYFEKSQKTKCGLEVSNYLKHNKRNEKLKELIFTPSTKADEGHDEDITEEEILKAKILTQKQLDEIKEISFSLFRFGQEYAKEKNLILVDTKFELGYDSKGNLIVIDEILTPDSSRYWYFGTYEELFKKDKPQKDLSKEFLRQQLIEAGYKPGSLTPPEMTEEMVIETSLRYIELYEQIMGKEFMPNTEDIKQRLCNNLKKIGLIKGFFVLIIAGSKSDDAHVKKIKQGLDKHGIPYEHRVCSAHKEPERLAEIIKKYDASIEPVIYVTVAGRSDGLSGTVAANTINPVIACPPHTDKFEGLDIFSTLRMPSGVAPMLVFQPENVGIAVLKIIALSDSKQRAKIISEIEAMRKKNVDADIERKN